MEALQVKQINIALFMWLISYSIIFSADNSQWRGPNRDGIYPETNLLKKWPKQGPKMLWAFQGIGEGHGSVAISKNRIYVTGMKDSIGTLYNFSMDGKLLWKKFYGSEWFKNYPGTRSTPTIVDNYLYLESGQGTVFCFDATSGRKIWSVDLLKKFNAENIRWGMAESLLIDKNRIFCTPGGATANVVALNRFTGKIIWTSPGHGDPAAYCSPILVNHNGNRLIVTMTAESIIGVDADTGEFYWHVPQYQNNKIHANTPLYFDGKILCSSSSSKIGNDGTVLLQLSDDAKRAEVIWRNEKFTNLMGGVIFKDGFIYGARYRKSEWYCLNWDTGEIQYIFKDLGGGVIVSADDRFYCYSDQGEIALVDANPEKFNVISSFNVPFGTDQHWAHPVIKDSRLYIRHGDALMVYDVAKNKQM